MDEIKRLEQEINALQAQIRQQNAEAARTRQRMAEENRRKLDEYQTQMQRAIREHDRATQAEYERLLKEYQDSVNSEAGARLARTDADYRRLLDSVQKNEAALLQKNRELERAIADLRGDINRRDEGSRAEAGQYLSGASNESRAIEARPHEKFAPGRLKILQNALADGRELFRAGLYEAAAAVGISARAGLQRLGYSIDDGVEEWDRQFDIFSLKLKYLKSRLHQETADWESFTGNSSKGDTKIRDANLAEINFWCRGEFDRISSVQKKYSRYVSDYSRSDKAEYLKNPDSPSPDDLKQFTQEIDKAVQRLTEISGLYKQRYSASCQRAEWGEKIVDFLTSEINLEWIEEQTGFREASPDTLASGDFTDYVKSRFEGQEVTEDLREWLKLVFENPSGNRIYIYILPIEAHGNVTNRIILHIDYDGPEQELYSRDIYLHICEAIQLEDESDGTVNYAADIDELKASGNKAYSETGKDLERAKAH